MLNIIKSLVNKIKFKKKKKIKIFYEDEFLKISYLDEIFSDKCLVAFTGVGYGMGGIDIQREEFFHQHKLGMIIWITDKKRSWGNNFDIKKISNQIKLLTKDKEIFIIGNSMGGFLGILFSKYINAKKVLAFVPQFSVSRDIIPSEKRWIKYTKFIKNFRYKDLVESFASQTEYALLFGDDKEDNVHYLKFQDFLKMSNVQIIKFKNSDHNVARYLKKLNLLDECIVTFFGKDLFNNFCKKNSLDIY